MKLRKRWFGHAKRSSKMQSEAERGITDQQGQKDPAYAGLPSKPGFDTAIFAGGCFWCMVSPFDELPGIVSVVSGYTGGHTENPTYDEVASETTGHAEAVRIVFEPEIFPYKRLLELFWQQIDPTDAGGQFQDRGASYRTAIFTSNDQQRKEAEASKRDLQKSGRFKSKIVTEITEAGPFYPAEEEHQDYYKRSFGHYRLYRQHSGRDTFIHEHWDTDRDRERLRQQLTETEYNVMIRGDMETAFDNAYWNETRPGTYVDRLSGDPLFDAADKYDAGDGWPAFSKTSGSRLVKREAALGSNTVRTALVSRLTGIKLGYLLYDGPGDQRLHYRVNSAALRFVPQDEME
ncbi:peptide-methionine (R)-S-oxide reductase [Saccharibacillus endophyticus]|uniref:Peptide methionine sulfoxide reductase MsrA n=2 Tax=Saccharibacillus endophyticus TaxID=2060666 RepID=A0ABQ1ZPX6_9BACL|nr:peptide-methionine (S)-S-oxide reductase MsrA [Saccharibacillus endophyticus]GGH71878.1 peptide-methionine (R)-S-oxide reductase [Saccharibacillus endophyticus]